jgi:hypothetical protein
MAALTQLPASGRDGETPDWPLSRATKAETAVWAQVWVTPQSVAWEQLGWTRSVARYVRLLCQAEKPNASAAVAAEVRQMEDRLGLTPMAMLRLRWEIRPDEAPLAAAEVVEGRWGELKVADTA